MSLLHRSELLLRKRHVFSLGAKPLVARGYAILASLAVLVSALVIYLWLTMPDTASLTRDVPLRTSYMRHRAKELGVPATVSTLRWVPLNDISPLLVCAVVKAEDRGFFRHHGIEWPAVRKALYQALKGEGERGASTISQQLARNLYLSPKPSLNRKLQEALIARSLESHLSKTRILELYLNTIEWGNGIWGIGPASQHYFGVMPARLDAFEASVLASLIAAPRRSLSGNNRLRASRVQRRVLMQLYRAEILGRSELNNAIVSANILHAELIRGVSFSNAVQLVKNRRPPSEEPRFGSSPVVLEAAIAHECGLNQELRNEWLPR